MNKKLSKEITNNLPILSNLQELNELFKDLMVNEGEELIYAFTDRKKNRCNAFLFTTHKLIIADRAPNVPFKFGGYHLSGWGGDLNIEYDCIDVIKTTQNYKWFTRRKMDLSVVFENFEAFLSSKDTDNFITLLNAIKLEIFQQSDYLKYC
jgi:hypothetical protein